MLLSDKEESKTILIFILSHCQLIPKEKRNSTWWQLDLKKDPAQSH